MGKRKKPLTLIALLREIGSAPGRYLALTAIVALGVGFFAGLRICRDDMAETASGYLGRQNLFDYRLLSTVGFDDEAEKALVDDPAVSEAECAYACDAQYLTEDGAAAVAKFHSLTEKINRPLLTAGRLPENDGECAVDCRFFPESVIGTELVLTEDSAENFTRESFTVTGLCFSPLYLNYERGATNLGTGSVSCFVILHPTAFTAEAYTEAYVTLKDAPAAFHDGYRDYAESMADRMEDLLDGVSVARLDRATADARGEIADGEAELADAREELDRAKNEDLPKLRDGIAEAEDGIGQLEDGISKAEKALDDFPAIREQTRAAVLDEIATALGLPAEVIPADHPAVLAALSDADAELDRQEDALRETLQSLRDKRTETAELRDELKNALSDAEEAVRDGEESIKEHEAELADAKEELRKVEDVRTYALDRFANVGYACFENDVAIVEGISRVFPVFFFLVAALVCATTMTRMIAEERTQIGTRKALGYTAGQISRKYLLYAGSAALVGTAGGYALGTGIIPEIIWKVYQIMYGSFAPLCHVFVPHLLAVSFAAAVLCTVGTAWVTGRAVLSERPAALIRPKAPKAGKRILLERIPFLWRRMSFLHKVSARNILRYRNRLWMMILGIGGCFALLLTGAGIRDSITGIVEVQYGRVAHYDYAVTVSDELTEEEREVFALETAPSVKKILWLHESSAEVRSGAGVKTAYLVIPEDTGELFREMITLEKDGEELSFPESGTCTIDAHLAEQLNLSPGDPVTITSGGVAAQLTVSSVCENYVNSYVYMTPATFRDAFGTDAEVKTAYVTAPEGTDPYAGGALLLDREDVVNVTVSRAVKDRIAGFLGNLDYIVLLVIVCAGLLAFIVLYELTEINITERTREIATVKVLGFYRGETASYVFRENRVLTLLGSLAGIPMGFLLHRFVMSRIKVDMVYFVPRVSPLSCLFAFLLTCVFAALVHLAMRRRIAGIPMAESLKSVE